MAAAHWLTTFIGIPARDAQLLVWMGAAVVVAAGVKLLEWLTE